jgi:tryptophan 2,3-dioxygenase
LDEILTAQRPLSEEHDELLFIVIHQVYELWFKTLIHELVELQRRLEEGHGPHALHTLRRVLAILKTIVAQIDVLETMNPRQFGNFRTRLESASGFQSAQFRELEAVLGRRDRRVLAQYGDDSGAQATIAAAMERLSVYDSFLRYLVHCSYEIPADRLERDVTMPVEESGAVQAAVLVAYRDAAEAAQVCERMVDLDEGLQEWRYRHLKMVERTIGSRSGTGGSPGAPYLHATLNQPMFPDLWSVRGDL